MGLRGAGWIAALALVGCAAPDLVQVPDGGPDGGPDAPAEDARVDAGARPDAAPAEDAAAPNRPPVILELGADPERGLAPLTTVLRWRVDDPEGDPLSCALDTDGDGAFELGPAPCAATSSAAWTYVDVGRRLTRLEVADGRGGADGAQVTVNAERPFALPSYLDADYALAGAEVPDLDAAAATCVEAVPAVDGSDVSDALAAAVRAAAARVPPGGHCVVQLPEGTFPLTRTVSLGDGIVVRGAGAARTTLQANLPSASPAFAATGGAPAHREDGEVTRGDKGRRALTVSATVAAVAAALLAAGEVYGELSVDNDPLKFPAEWATDYSAYAIGQVFRVRAVTGDVLTLDRPLNEPYLSGERRLELRGADRVVERVGLADLKIVRVDAQHAGTVAFDRTADAFLLRVALEKTGWAHVHVDRSLACTVRHSYLFDAHDFGDGGRGYGVNLRSHTTGCLIEDNAFRRLRHAIILQLGSNGNVVAYNVAEDARDNLGWLKADISLHGHYTHMNLIEGNVVEKIHVSDWWGPAPFHVVYANRASRGGVTVDDRSEDCAVIDNVAQASFPLEAALRVDRSVSAVLCVHNLGPDGAPLRAAHRDCDDENDPAVSREPPRPPSLYRPQSLWTPDGRLPAQVRLNQGQPVPLPP